MEIQNEERPAVRQNMLNCSWISRYPEEDERLFVANKYQLTIESIRIINTSRNLKVFFQALRWFDLSMNDDAYLRHELMNNDVGILNLLLTDKLGTSKAKMDIDSYILNNFNLYLSRKTRIELKMSALYEKDITSLFYELSPSNVRKKDHFTVAFPVKYKVIANIEPTEGAKSNHQIAYWGKKTDFNGVSSIGYQCDNGEIIWAECMRQNKKNRKIFLNFGIGDYSWLDIPNDRIWSIYPDKQVYKYYQEIEFEKEEIAANYEEKESYDDNQHKSKSVSIEDWNKKTHFDAGSFIGYKSDDGKIIKTKYIGHNVLKNKIWVGFAGNEGKWLDIPNERICSPYQHLWIKKQYNEYIKDFYGLNVLHPNIFKLFKNIKHITIDVGNHGNYQFDLLSFLSVIMKSDKRNITYQIRAYRSKNMDTWLADRVTPSVTLSYKDNGWEIEYEKEKRMGCCYDIIFVRPWI